MTTNKGGFLLPRPTNRECSIAAAVASMLVADGWVWDGTDRDSLEAGILYEIVGIRSAEQRIASGKWKKEF